jgi:hypothetical protein
VSLCRVHDALQPGCPDCFPHLRALALHVGEPCVPVSALRALVEQWRAQAGMTSGDGLAAFLACAKKLAALCDAQERK